MDSADRIASPRRLLAWRPGRYARDSAETLFWLLLRACLQAVSVVLLARLLGPSDYGAFIAALAVVVFFVPLAGLGLGGVLVRDGAANLRRLPGLLGSSLWLWGRAALGFGLAAAAAAWLVLPAGGPAAWWALLLLALGEVASASGVELLARARQAKQQMRAFGAGMAGLVAARLLAMLGFALFSKHDAQTWMAIYGGSSLAYLLFLATAWQREWRGHARAQPGLWREGLPFATAALSARLQAEFNKPALAHLSYAHAGAYNIAQHAVDIVSLPLAAMQESLWPRAFSDANPRRQLCYALYPMLALALALGALLTLAAPALPWLLGSGYEGAVATLQWLAWLPLLQALRNVGNGWLIAAGLSQRLTQVYVVGALFSVAICLLLIPRWGLAGAVAAAYGGEVALIMAQWLSRKSKRGMGA